MLDGKNLGDDAGLLERISAKIAELQEKSDASGILFNLTPEQMSQLQKDIALAQQTGEMPKPPKGFSFIMANLTAPAAEAAAMDGDDASLVNTLPFAKTDEGLAGGAEGDLLLNNKPEKSSMNALLQGTSDADLNDLMDIQSSTDKFSALLKNAARLRQQSEGGYTPQTQAPASNASAQRLQRKITAPMSQQRSAACLMIMARSWQALAGIKKPYSKWV